MQSISGEKYTTITGRNYDIEPIAPLKKGYHQLNEIDEDDPFGDGEMVGTGSYLTQEEMDEIPF